MQLFSATTLLLASIVGSASATIVESGIYFLPERLDDPDPVRMRAVICDSGTCTKQKRVPGTGRVRKLADDEPNRHLEVVLRQPADKAPVNSEHAILFKISGLTGDSMLMLYKEGCSPIMETLDVNRGGETVELITPKPSGEGCTLEGEYKWSVDYTNEDGEDSTIEGGTFTYSHVVTVPVVATASSRARVGPTQTQSAVTNSGAVGGDVEESPYEGGGNVQDAVGRIYFASNGVDYACTGTAVKDHKTGRSLIFTAAHCVWDDIDENFGHDAIFIPNRDAVVPQDENATMADIHRGCEDDICGCWKLSGGIVHDKWRDTPWPDRLAYDYGFYVVEDTGSHLGGENCGSDALDIAVPAQDFLVGTEIEGEHVTNFGYSLVYNPDFRYCAESPITRDPTSGVTTLWMDNCGLSGGASGGPWMKNFDPATGSGKIVTTNSWSFSTRSGMGGPFIDESEARCLINAARDADIEEMMGQDEGEQGKFVSCFDRPCVEDEEAVRKLRGGRKLCSETNIIRKEEAKP